MKTFRDILSRNSTNIVITGDSLSYNRYDYDENIRINAFDCYPGMQSWSFRLRDAIWMNDPGFRFGIDIEGNSNYLTGNHNDVKEIPSEYMLFNGKTKTWVIQNNSEEIKININAHDTQMFLYMQKCPENGCNFDIYCDEKLCALNINNTGDMSYFQGWAPFTIPLKLKESREEHSIVFRNIRKNSDKAYITVSALGALNRNVYLTGKGSTDITFLIENFHERIGVYKPDLLIFTNGANDVRLVNPELYKANLIKFFNKIFTMNHDCRVISLFSTDMHNSHDPESDDDPYFSRKSLEPYRLAMKDACQKYDVCFFDTLQLFDNFTLEKWRFDNVHMTKFGNDLLFKKLSEMLF